MRSRQLLLVVILAICIVGGNWLVTMLSLQHWQGKEPPRLAIQEALSLDPHLVSEELSKLLNDLSKRLARIEEALAKADLSPTREVTHGEAMDRLVVILRQIEAKIDSLRLVSGVAAASIGQLAQNYPAVNRTAVLSRLEMTLDQLQQDLILKTVENILTIFGKPTEIRSRTEHWILDYIVDDKRLSVYVRSGVVVQVDKSL